MAIDANLTKFNPEAFKDIRQNIEMIEKNIKSYQAQKTKIDYLFTFTLVTIAASIARVAWDIFSGIGLRSALQTRSSILLGLYNLALSVVTLWYLMDRENKANHITDEIQKIVRTTTTKFYGETVEIREDLETKKEVLESIQTNLQPHVEDRVRIEKNYQCIATNAITREGETIETFKCSPIKKIVDNFEEVKSTVGRWRKYYSDSYDPSSSNSEIMQAIASQCIQELPTMTIKDGSAQFICSSPSIINPTAGSIVRASQNKKDTYNSPADFQKYVNTLPKVTKY